ncbi:MAG: hypothetical protein HYY50_01275 [Candidatus Kerfeldbacteria bacterium]|nr:hypothetical protein [Candidatus Kerfeldbacteria bacterium]
MPNARSSENRSWLLAFSLQTAVVILECWSAGRTGSRALWSDFAHNANDVLLLILTALPTWQRGWRQPSLWVNIISLELSGLGAVLFGYRALHQVGSPVDYEHAWPVAVVSLVANLTIYGIVRPYRHHPHVQVFGWHQLWDVAAALSAAILLGAGSARPTLPLDAIATITIGCAMILHWPVTKLFERNNNHPH